MMWLNDILLFLHFVGLVLGAGPGVANMVIMRQAASATPEKAATLRQLPPLLVRISSYGLAVLWVTGIILVWSEWGGVTDLPAMFWVKMIFVLALTIIIGLIQKTIADIRRTGNPALAARLPRLGPLAGLSSLLAVLFAVLAFH